MEKIQLKSKDLEQVKQELLEKQKGVCILCERPFVDGLVACVDHDHVTGMVRAVLCLNCNGLAGKIEKRAMRAKQNLTMYQWLENFHKYITAEQTNYIHPSEAPKEPKVKKSSFNKMLKLFKEKYPKKKIPAYPRSGKLNKQLKKLFEEFQVEDYFYRD